MSEDVKSIDTALGKILKLQKEELKFDKKVEKERKEQKNREERDAKRKRADMFKKVKQEKTAGAKQVEKNGNLFEKLLGGLSGILGSIKDLLGGIGGLVTGGFAGLGIGTAIAGALGGIVTLLKPVIGTLVSGMTGLIGKSLVPIKTAIGALVGKAGGWGALGLLGLKGLLLGAAAAAPVAIAAGAGLINERIQDNRAGGGSGAALSREIRQARGEYVQSLSNRERRNASKTEESKRLTGLVQEINRSNSLRDREIREVTTYDSRGNQTSQDTEAVAKANAAHEARVADIRKRFENPVKRQLGGHINVPGYGEGDKVPMMLPEGSFVLNKMASMHFQTGGMVPTLLEPGEKVFMPGDWDSSISALNDMIPRFQTGGLVQAKHPDTGPGWSIGPDSQGRPSVFHKQAAQGLLDAIRDSDGMVKTSDITSSQRSVEKNRAVGGVPNSNHLSGYAVDIHGTSKAWLKKNGEKYGWKNLVYSGHDGHFDFKGAPVQQGDGKEQTADTDSSKGGGNKSILEGMMSTIGDGAKFLVEGTGAFLQGFNEGFKSETGFGFQDILGAAGGGATSLFSGLSSMVNKSSSGMGSTGDALAPSPGGAFSEKALIAELDRRGIKNKNERAMFLAQMAHESGNFRYDEEIHDGSNYEGRRDLGNTQPGDGRRYKGRGYIQLTGRANYKTYGDKLGIDLVNNPELAKDPNTAAAIAFEYWNSRVNREAARKGDVTTVTRNINGGLNGLEDRQNYYNKYSKQKLQRGGVVNRSTSPIMERMKKAQVAMEQMTAMSAEPIVVYEDAPPIKVSSSAAVSLMPPELPEGPGSAMASDYFYQLGLGAQ